MMFNSKRELLVLQAPYKVPVITVTQNRKWYTPFLVFPNGYVTQLDITSELEYGYVDHMFDPDMLQKLAKDIGAIIDIDTWAVVCDAWLESQRRKLIIRRLAHFE